MSSTDDIVKTIDEHEKRLRTMERSGAGGSDGSPNLDGGTPTSVYDAIDNIDAGGV
jgi:hypothetical protein